MCSVQTSVKSSIEFSIDSFLQDFSPSPVVFVAFSGGLDSTVLLHSLVHSKVLIERLIAVYVDHGLQEESKAWSSHCREVCVGLGVEFVALQVDVKDIQRKGIEAVARKLRYQALATTINGYALENSVLVTGHHQHDQAETVLLNLFRGAGANGLGAMPHCLPLKDSSNILHCRPLLAAPYSLLVGYAEKHKLKFVVDESNSSSSFRRNLVRNEIFPIIQSAWPSAAQSLANTASNMQEANYLLDEYAQKSLDEIEYTAVFIAIREAGGSNWIGQKNVLRYWFKVFWPSVILSRTHYDWIQSSLIAFENSENQAFTYKLPVGVIKVYKDRVYYLKRDLQSFDVAAESFLSPTYLGIGSSVLSERVFYFYYNDLYMGSKLVVRSISALDDINKKYLKRFFQQESIPVWERSVWPVLTTAKGEVISVLGCKKCICTENKRDKEQVLESISLSYMQRMELFGLV